MWTCRGRLCRGEQVKSTEYFDDEEGDELCNCEFSLAYGAKILLNNAALRLKRGRRYGLCGPNGVGKVRRRQPRGLSCSALGASGCASPASASTLKSLLPIFPYLSLVDAQVAAPYLSSARSPR